MSATRFLGRGRKVEESGRKIFTKTNLPLLTSRSANAGRGNMNVSGRKDALRYAETDYLAKTRVSLSTNSSASAFFSVRGGSRRRIFVPAQPVKTCSSYTRWLRTSL